MKKRLHDKKAGIALLLSLIIISLAEVIFRAVVLGKDVLTTSNLGEQLAVIALATIILILTARTEFASFAMVPGQAILCLTNFLSFQALS